MIKFKKGDKVFVEFEVLDTCHSSDYMLAKDKSNQTRWLLKSEVQVPPKKVVIPQFVAEWIKKYRHAHTLTKVLNAVENGHVTPSSVNDWIVDNRRDFIMAWLDGYEVEKEVLYQIPLKGLVTTDGQQQYLTGKHGKYFASKKHSDLKQTFNQSELDNDVPKQYRHFAKEVE